MNSTCHETSRFFYNLTGNSLQFFIRFVWCLVYLYSSIGSFAISPCITSEGR